MSGVRAPARPIGARVAWAALAVFLLAFIALEVIKHGGGALVGALLLLAAPEVTVVLGRVVGDRRLVPFYNAVHRPWLPLALLVVYSVGGLGDRVPLFTAGLGWLAHIAVERALGHGLRARNGSPRA
jgi:Domain of unknown function (DUF4260)